MNTTRKYGYRDIDMLTAVEIIIDNAIANKDFLIAKRPIWDDPFFYALKEEITKTIDEHLGKDAAKQMREATITMNKIKEKALNLFIDCKVQIDEDFKKDTVRRTEILKQLGFDTYYKTARKGINEAIVNLLFQFKQNLTIELKTEIIDNGTSEEILNNIVGIAEKLKSQNISQETFKSTRKDITKEVIDAFNDIYDKVISVANISKKFFKDDNNKKDMFTISKIIATLSSSGVKKNVAKPKTNDEKLLLNPKQNEN